MFDAYRELAYTIIAGVLVLGFGAILIATSIKPVREAYQAQEESQQATQQVQQKTQESQQETQQKYTVSEDSLKELSKDYKVVVDPDKNEIILEPK